MFWLNQLVRVRVRCRVLIRVRCRVRNRVRVNHNWLIELNVSVNKPFMMSRSQYKCHQNWFSNFEILH